ncbi:hypothetical protein Tco_0236225 [Tanacetum coccineum]
MFIEQSHDEVYGCLKGGSGNSGGKRLAISMVEEAWLSAKEEAEAIATTVSDHVSSDPVPQCLTTALEQDNLYPGPQSQENVPQAAETVTTSNELDLLFSLMFDELLNGNTPVVSKSSVVTAADAPNPRQQQNKLNLLQQPFAADTPPLEHF